MLLGGHGRSPGPAPIGCHSQAGADPRLTFPVGPSSPGGLPCDTIAESWWSSMSPEG